MTPAEKEQTIEMMLALRPKSSVERDASGLWRVWEDGTSDDRHVHMDLYTALKLATTDKGSEEEDQIMEQTALLESKNRFDAWNPDDNGAGVSYGFIQFNQKRGSLPELLAEMHKEWPQLFNRHFGKDAAAFRIPAALRQMDLNLSFNKRLLIEAAHMPEFKAVQRSFAAKTYLEPALELVRFYGLHHSTALKALAFDAAVQLGPGGMKRAFKKAWEVERGNPEAFLARFAEEADRAAGATCNRRATILKTFKKRGIA